MPLLPSALVRPSQDCVWRKSLRHNRRRRRRAKGRDNNQPGNVQILLRCRAKLCHRLCNFIRATAVRPATLQMAAAAIHRSSGSDIAVAVRWYILRQWYTESLSGLQFFGEEKLCFPGLSALRPTICACTNVFTRIVIYLYTHIHVYNICVYVYACIRITSPFLQVGWQC